MQTLIIWAYGASVNRFMIELSSSGSPTGSYLLQSANIGDGSVTLVNSGDAANISSGTWVMVGGLENQTFGEPANLTYMEFKYVTGVVGSVISLDSPLKNAYLSTWPDQGSTLGGAARVFTVPSSWPVNFTIYGLHIRNRDTSDANFGQVVLAGRVFNGTDLVFDCCAPTPTSSSQFSCNFCEMSSPEIDKNIEFMSFYRSSARIWTIQSAANITSLFSGVTARTNFQGTTKNTTIVNSNLAAMFVGPTTYGHGVNLLLDGTFVGSAARSNNSMPSTTADASFTFSAGTFTMPKSDPNDIAVYGAAVPGLTYYFGDSDGTNNSSPHTTFHITAVREDATNLYVDTDIGNTLPTPTCNTHSCPKYVAYQAETITQINSPAGSANIASFAPP